MKANLPYKACKKEIKNPSEKNQKDFCLCKLLVSFFAFFKILF